ncbi:hypothetical protein EBR96_00965, partial [bacterium]|nr:hypothetical protein [bacterium]
KHGLWHGDINLSSILLTKSGELILIHPMLHAELIRNSLPKLSKMDTAMFMAPEQLNQAAGNGRCDMYAIGVLLFLFFSNQWPIPFSTDLATIRQNILGEPIPFRKINQGVSDLIGDVISTCLAKLPSERFPSVATLRSRISNVLIPEPGPGRPDIADAQPTPTAALESAIDTESSFLNSLLTRRNGMVAVAISVAFLILFVIYRIYVGYVTALPVSIVPELKGLSVAEATRLLEEQHLRAEVAGQRADYSVPDGAIVEMRHPSRCQQGTAG